MACQHYETYVDFPRGGTWVNVCLESIFLSRVEGRGFHVEGEGTMSRVTFFFQFFLLGKGSNRRNQCH